MSDPRLPYDPPGKKCQRGTALGGAQPGAYALQELLLTLFPGAHSLGIYNCRPVRHGTGLSFHAEGRAMDIAPVSDAQGYALAEMAVEYAAVWGVQEVIDYRRLRRWDSRRGWNDYRAHGEAHVHVTVTWASAARQQQPNPNGRKGNGVHEMFMVILYDGEAPQYGGTVWLLRGQMATPLADMRERDQLAASGVPGPTRFAVDVAQRLFKRSDGQQW